MLLLAIGILLALLGFTTRKRYNLLLGVSVIFVVMAFQSNVMSDYQNYLEAYSYSEQTGKMDVRTAQDEPLWAGLFYVFSQVFPFWIFIIFLSSVQCIILYIFIKKYCKNPYEWLVPVLFYFTFNMMLLQMYVIRQGLSIALVLLAFIYVDKTRKLYVPLIISLLAFTIHNSSLVALPFIIIYYSFLRKEQGRYMSGKFGKISLVPFIVTGVFLVLYIVKDRFLSGYLIPLSMALGDDFRLSGYLNEDSADGMSNAFTISPLIALYDAIIVFVVSWFYGNSSRRMKVFCAISIVVAFGDMMLFGIGSIPRILMYFVPFNLPVYSSLLTQMKKQFGWIWSFVFSVFLIGYALKTSLPWLIGTDGDQFGNYKFIFMP